MKLAALYTVWNGEELLENSIKQIYDHVDVIIIAWQLRSNKGEINPNIIEFVQRFVNDKKVKLIKFTPDLSKSTKENEREKLQLRIDLAKKLYCTHFFSSACDHYYNTSEFIKAKEFCKKNDYDVTFTKMYTYYKNPTWQLMPIENYQMPFICKLYSNTQVVKKANYPVLVDPSIKINPAEKFYLFKENEIMMHHYSMVRVDIKNKFRNAAASIRWNKEQIEGFIDQYENYNIEHNPGVKYFKGRKIKVVENYFNI